MGNNNAAMKLPRRSYGFSLIELLVGLAVVAALATWLLPALVNARRRTLQATDANQLRQLSNAATLFSMEHDYYIIVGTDKNDCFGYGTNTEWFKLLRPYLGHAMNGTETIPAYISPGDDSGGGREKLGPSRAYKYRSYGINLRTERLGSVRDQNNSIIHRASDPLKVTDVFKPAELLVMGNANIGKVGDTSGFNSRSSSYIEGHIFPTDWFGNDRANFAFLDGHVESIPIKDILPGGTRSVLFDRDTPVE